MKWHPRENANIERERGRERETERQRERVDLVGHFDILPKLETTTITCCCRTQIKQLSFNGANEISKVKTKNSY
jgi:hypothetical protein